jgi:hypothetical protein
MADNFNLRQFLTENKLTKNAKLLNENVDIPNDIVWTAEDEDTASQGTFNTFDQEASELDGYDVELTGYSPSTGKAYEGFANGSYGETDYDSVDGIRELNPREAEYYLNALRKERPELFTKVPKSDNTQQNRGMEEASSGDMAYTEKVKKKQVNNSKQLKEGQQLVELFTFGYDFDNIEEVEDYLIANYKVASNAPHILGIENDANPDCELIIGYGDTIINGVEVYNPAILQDKELMRLIELCDGEGHYEEEDEVEDLDEAMPPANNMYSAHNFDGVAREAKKHKHLMKIANELFPQYGGDLENFKPLSPLERQQVYKQYTADTKVIPFKESKLTAKERKLVKLVENALGIQKEVADQYGYDPDNEEWEPEDDYPGQTRYVSRRDIEEGEEMVNEKPLPKYENIEKLMQEIEAGTNEAAHSYKMKRMKEIAEMLEAKVGSLEEGEGADFVDAKKVKQMKKDIMTLRKHAEKLEKEYDKKFAKKDKPASAPKTEKVEALQETTMKTFDLKKFLTENKLTTNSRMVNEDYKVHDLVFIKSNGQFETKPREIHQISGNQYVVSGHIKRDDGKGYSTQGGTAVNKEDVKLASLDENGTYTQKEILRGSMQGFKAPNPEELKVNMMIAPNMSYGDSQEQLNQEMGRITAISGDKVTYKKGDGKLYNANVDDIIIVAS